MSSHQQAREYDDEVQTTEHDEASSLRAWLTDRASDGSLALLAGTVLLAGAVRSRGRLRRIAQGFVGGSLIVLGIRQRSGDSVPVDSTDTDEGVLDAFENRARRQILGEAGATSGGHPPKSGAETAGEEIHADPRQGEDVTDEVGSESETEDGIDLSAAATADEPGEAVGPAPEQAQPTETDGSETQPDPAEGVRMAGAEGSEEGVDDGGEDNERSYADPDEAAQRSRDPPEDSGAMDESAESEEGDDHESEDVVDNGSNTPEGTDDTVD